MFSSLSCCPSNSFPRDSVPSHILREFLGASNHLPRRPFPSSPPFSNSVHSLVSVPLPPQVLYRAPSPCTPPSSLYSMEFPACFHSLVYLIKQLGVPNVFTFSCLTQASVSCLHNGLNSRRAGDPVQCPV